MTTVAKKRPGHFIDLTGQEFGLWTVLRIADEKKNNHIYWVCECKCGTVKEVNGQTLRNGKGKGSTSCGCTARNVEDLTDRVFGRLTVICRAENSKNGSAKWLCRCECGNERKYRRCDLMGKYAFLSCGCYGKERASERSKTHGHTVKPVNGRGRATPEYNTWASMIQRCTNPNCEEYRYYGGRGIQVCDRWLNSFENFLEDMGSRPKGTSLDRYPNNNGNYELGNCRWATRAEQMRNTRRNHFLTYQGRTQCIQDWSKEMGISFSAILGRLERGLSDEEALSMPKFGKRQPTMFTHNGITKSLQEWSAISGVHINTMRGRIQKGLPSHEVLAPVKR